ncbi:MAG: class I SAM-dependent methyltransferase [Planctomycetes bacterium]|nr:class I SAM-dependent methyltransferase [Planctomycetota bacterium]
MTVLHHELVAFASRQDRPRWLSGRFADLLEGSVLDVGCDAAVLRDHVTRGHYVGVDRSSAADVKHDLQSGGALPFADRSFDTVICTDVLEHLDNLHAIFAELVRVSARHVLVSLPNNWNAARLPLRRGRGSFKHYGLPLDPPEDRHRWFFSLIEAREFLEGQAERQGLVIRELIALEKPRRRALVLLRRLLHPGPRYLNLFSHTLVCHYERG